MLLFAGVCGDNRQEGRQSRSSPKGSIQNKEVRSDWNLRIRWPRETLRAVLLPLVALFEHVASIFRGFDFVSTLCMLRVMIWRVFFHLETIGYLVCRHPLLSASTTLHLALTSRCLAPSPMLPVQPRYLSDASKHIFTLHPRTCISRKCWQLMQECCS